MKVERVSGNLGSAGNASPARTQPAVLGSLPSTIFVGKLPTNAGKLPALPDPKKRAIEN
jgi:hypothetical protein